MEGKSGSSKKGWLKFLVTALKSVNESKYWLCLLRDTLDAEKSKIQELLLEADEILKIIACIIIKSGS